MCRIKRMMPSRTRSSSKKKKTKGGEKKGKWKNLEKKNDSRFCNTVTPLVGPIPIGKKGEQA